MRTKTWCPTLGPVAAIVLAGCAPGQNPIDAVGDAIDDGMRKIEDVVYNGRPPGYLYDKKAWKSRDATYNGELVSVTDARTLVAGNTIVLDWVQTKKDPHLDQDMVSHRNILIYFRADGTADSFAWVGRPWAVSDNTVCIQAPDGQICESFVRDASGALFDHSEYLNTFVRVARIEPGDPEQVAVAYATIQREKAEREAQINQGAFDIITGRPPRMLDDALNEVTGQPTP